MKKHFALAILLLCFTGCGVLKNGTTYFGEERVFGKWFNKTYPTLSREAQMGESNWELGIAFMPHKAGRIKAVRIKNPTKGSVRLSLWDADTRALLKTFDYGIYDTENYNMRLYEFPLEANKKYCITINVHKYFYQRLPLTPLPLKLQDITLLSSVYEETPYQRFPQQAANDVLHGLIDLDIDWIVK